MNFQNIILFPHNSGQLLINVKYTPLYLDKFINHKKHKVKVVITNENLFYNLKNLYLINKNIKEQIINIGGDHSMSIATIADSLNKYPNLKVIYFDAHADINTFNSSKTKQFHGMVLSYLTGIDNNKYFKFIKNKLTFENLLYIGTRNVDLFENKLIQKKHIQFLTPTDINNNLKDSLNKILKFVDNSPVHISFDVDVVDPKYISSTGTPVKNGIKLNNAITILNSLNNANIIKLDITELNLTIGNKSKSIKNTLKLFNNFINFRKIYL